jgi:hypothetical protein
VKHEITDIVIDIDQPVRSVCGRAYQIDRTSQRITFDMMQLGDVERLIEGKARLVLEDVPIAERKRKAVLDRLPVFEVGSVYRCKDAREQLADRIVQAVEAIHD